MKAIDLLAGAGGLTEGAEQAGVDVEWVTNHSEVALEFHKKNHPNAEHVCQDIHNVNPSMAPRHDILLGAPCCQGHSPARGKENGDPQHDASRATAWGCLSFGEYHKPPFVLLENVPQFTVWALWPAYRMAWQDLGYCLSPIVVDAADFGVPQHRKRLLLVMTRSKHPIMLDLLNREHVPASSFICWDEGAWTEIERPGRARSTLERVRNGRKRYGDRFLMPYYGSGSGKTGRSIARPIGTITTRDRWAIVDGNKMRMLSKEECRAAMGFPDDYILPEKHSLAVHMLGNAVVPRMAADAIAAMLAAA